MPYGLTQRHQLPSVLRTGLADQVMELQLNPGREWERPIHRLGGKTRDVPAGRGDTSKKICYHVVTTVSNILGRIITKARESSEFLHALSSVTCLKLSLVVSRLATIPVVDAR